MTHDQSNASFSIIPNWVFRSDMLDAYQLLVYMALLNRANSEGYAWPSIQTIARESRTSPATVRRAIKRLQQDGLVQVTKRTGHDGGNTSNLYKVRIFQRSEPTHDGGYPADSGGLSTGDGGGIPRIPEVDTLEVDTLEVDCEVDSTSRPAQKLLHATKKQLNYLHDLHIHLNNEVPDQTTVSQWAAMSPPQATELIKRYLATIPRYDAYEGPDYGDEVYGALSSKGQEFADTGMLPV